MIVLQIFMLCVYTTLSALTLAAAVNLFTD